MARLLPVRAREGDGLTPRVDKIVLPKLRGFCAGVVRAIDIVDELLERVGPPVYVRKEIVHNRYVVETLKAKGAVFVDELDEVPGGGWAVFSAHGVSPEVRAHAKARRLRVVDATCPLVTKVHLEAIHYAKDGCTILLVGHADHDETIGTYGEAPGRIQVVETLADAEAVQVEDPSKVAALTQTTLSVDETRDILAALRRRFPALRTPPKDDICYATTNRQDAVKALAPHVDVVLVLGAPNSSNTRRMVEVAEQAGKPAYLIERGSDIQDAWLEGRARVGLTSSASAPEVLVTETIEALRTRYGARTVEELATVEESVSFALPAELQALGA